MAETPEITNTFSSWILPIVGAAIGAAVMYGINVLQGRDAKNQTKRLLEQTKLDCENMTKSAELEKKEKLLQQQSRFDGDNQKIKDELRKRESTLERKEEQLKQSAEDARKQEKLVENTQRKLTERLEDVARKNELYAKLIQQQQSDLTRVTGMSVDEAKKQLMSILEKELQGELGSVILKHERKVAEITQQKTQDILLVAMQRYASAQTSESSTSTVDIPSDDMKGRIIGREGRNIRSFEKVSGCGSEAPPRLP